MDYVTVQGEDVPALGLGTYGLRGQDCAETVETALEMGYRHLDTAESYGNERAVGRGLRAADVDREDVFLTTKVLPTRLTRASLVDAASACVERLGVEYVDLLLCHWPNPLLPAETTLGALADAREAGLARHVGVSNYDRDRLARALRDSPVDLFCDQVECNPYRPRPDVLGLCQERDLLFVAYSPLARGAASEDSVLADVGRRHGKSAAQVALRWVLQQDGVAAIPKASDPDHLRENLAVFDFELSAAELARAGRPSLVRSTRSWLRGRLGA